MWEESKEHYEQTSVLRTGLTTGSCATACSLAAAICLLTKQQPKSVSITLPKGKTVELTIDRYEWEQHFVRTVTIKDAGDDPDVTHGAHVFVELALCEQPGVFFNAASGVGTVTKEGLLLDVGEPAINPVPRKMIAHHLQTLADKHHYVGGFMVAIGVENGEQLAKKTMNPRLGITGGLSILGTTGIVRPFSCAAWITSIYQGIDVASANGIQHIAASTGNRSEQAIKDYYQLEDIALIEMGDFVGAVLKHVKKRPVNKLSLCGGFGKISKLAQGHMDLNSRVSAIDFRFLSRIAKEQGAEAALCEKILHANTSIEALKYCQKSGIDLAFEICQRALGVAKRIVSNSIDLEIISINRQGQFVGSTNPDIFPGL
ncbi:cobalt-precorrin-5B (C(1))-methyltransferase [Candidatus Endobugula sertula]|uniref:Cobalt-precorrin-5B C(1)-methyltransferase n=1 Tax=Candidatus Endobugula sertula TaxID=62101 RepID=A0A1D2QM18_9GAMM|nr:cobalt-precorrin-5B (C(1))-methyltransferase [Candidatus Endobugula sertula]